MVSSKNGEDKGNIKMNTYKAYFKKYRLMFIIAVSCVFFEAVCDLLQPTIMARIIDDGVKNRSIETVLHFGLVMLGITALGACFAATRNILASKVSQSFGAELRYDVFKKIMSFSESGADSMESGSLITRMTNDTSQVTQFVNGIMRIFLKAPITCVGSIALAVILSPFMSMALLAAIAIVAVLIIISMKMSYVRFSKVQKAVDKVNTVVQEYLMGIRLVKAFGRNDEEEQKFEAANSDLYTKSTASQVVIAYFSPLMSLTVSIGIAVIIYLGSLMFGKGQVEVGKVAAFVNYMTQILTSLIMITNIFNTFIRTKASSQRIEEVLSGEEDFVCSGNSPGSIGCTVKDTTEGYVQAATTGQLEFKNVAFSYPGGSGIPVLKNLSFKLSAGEILAVIGPTGAGKSTLASLCLRFYDVDEGSVLINGKDVKSIDTRDLREKIAYAPQKSMLFTGTVRDNISWGIENPKEDQIIRAARIAQASEFIENMPDKYDSRLGQSGVNLSGGQRQRLSIARALAKEAPILILDDCTSALDAITEARVRKALKSIDKGKSVIMITQSVGTAISADKILVLDNGVNVGFGSHSDLLESCSTYREIYNSQIGGNIYKHVQ